MARNGAGKRSAPAVEVAGRGPAQLEARPALSPPGHRQLLLSSRPTIGRGEGSESRRSPERQSAPLGRFQEGAIRAAKAAFREASVRRDYGTMEGGRVEHALFFCSLDGMGDPAVTTSEAG